jgi:Fic family protein
MAYAGYELVRNSLKLPAIAPARPAIVRPITRIEAIEGHLAIPPHVVPQTEDPLTHLLFALKHEGVNMQILAQALPKIPAERMLKELKDSPNGQYVRAACYLWELHTGAVLEGKPDIAGRYVNLFDPGRYVTGPDRRNSRWRLNFNGLGSPSYCVTVERTPAVQAGIESDVLGRTKAFIDSLGKEMMDRALSWAYLHETEDSYAIEREAPSEDKARKFIALLKQAHEGRPLSEEYLVELQSSTVSGAFEKAVQFRNEQNWLRSGGNREGSSSVSYVPPPPDAVPRLMDEWMAFANSAPRQIDPIVAASIASFGFVYIHPFMDGNGRLSRFLFHKALCTSGRLEKGVLLPVSVAMKRHERQYLEALQAFSVPARELVQVTSAGEGRFYFDFKADDTLYRYWDATAAVEFGFAMAEQALDVELRQETQYLAHFDAIRRAIDERYDVRGSLLATLISIALDGGGTISNSKRKRFAANLPAEVFDAIEAETRAVLTVPPDSGGSATESPRR